MAKLTKKDMIQLQEKYDNLATPERKVEQLDTKNRSFILADSTRLTTSEFMKELARLQAEVRPTKCRRGRPIGSGTKDKMVENAMEKRGKFTINDLTKDVPGVTRVYLTIIANKRAKMVGKNGKSKVFEYAKN